MTAYVSLLDRRPGETPTLSRRTQRWNRGQMKWQLEDPQERFDARRYEVREIPDDTTAKSYILAHHYSGSYPNAKRRFGLYRAGLLVGVAVYSLPITYWALTCVLPELAPGVESLELGRLVLNHEEPGNSESWFVARCHEVPAAGGVRGIVSCADPVPRHSADGTAVFPGHVGWIYQGLNGFYTGRTTKRTNWLLPDGTVVSDRAKQKIRDQDQGHDYAERQLVQWGAQPMRAGESPKEWLQRARYDANIRLLRHHGCHRYVFTLGGRAERRDVRVALPFLTYPKAVHGQLSEVERILRDLMTN